MKTTQGEDNPRKLLETPEGSSEAAETLPWSVPSLYIHPD